MSDDGFQAELPDGKSLHVHRWLPAGPARATLLVLHGMAEHGARYARLAQALNAAGWAVYVPDLPGHGRSARTEQELGHFADHDSWNYTLDAIHRVRLQAAREQQAPLFLLGHSMGSLLAQSYVAEHNEGLAGLVLSATTGSLGAVRVPALWLLRAEAAFYGARHPSALAEALSFRTFNKPFETAGAPARTAFEWLSRNPAEVDKYVADPRCGFRCSARLWADLCAASAAFLDPRRLARIRKELPILLIAGSDDPVSQGERGPRMLVEAYQRAGIRDVEMRIYPGARHELLNETRECRDQVTAELLAWLDQHLRA